MPVIIETAEFSGAEESAPLVQERRSQGGGGGGVGRAAWGAVVCWATVATYFAVANRPSAGGLRTDAAGVDSAISLAAGGRGGGHGGGNSGGNGGGEAWGHLKKDNFYPLFKHVLQHAKYIDLTHAFSPESPVWPGFGQATFGPGVSGGDYDGFSKMGEPFTYSDHGFQVGTYTVPTDQYGTQLDPPAHWNEFGATISDVPATVAVRPLVVLDIHEQVAANSSYHATVDDAKAWEKEHGHIPKGAVVMVRSDWSKGWESYTGALPDKYPGVTLDLLKFLHLDRNILFHGHEPLDTDMTPTLEGEAWLMHNNYMQAEGVTNLDKVPPHGCLVSIGFAKPKGGLGGFARYIAICPQHTEEGVTIKDEPGAPLDTQAHPLRRNSAGVMVPDADATPIEYCQVEGALGCVGTKPTWEE